MTIRVYTFEDENGTEHGSFSTQSPGEAEEHGRKYGLRVIENHYEWVDSEVAWDFIGGADK